MSRGRRPLGLWLLSTALLVAEPPVCASEPYQASAPEARERQAAEPSAEASGAASRSERAAEAPVIQIQELPSPHGTPARYAMELRDADIADVFRVLAHDYQLNLLVDSRVTGRITASFTNVGLQEALNALAESSQLALTRQGNILKLTPNVLTTTFPLDHVEASTILSDPVDGSTIHDLLSAEGKVLLGTQPNSIMVIDYPENTAKVKQFLSMVDQRMASRVFALKYLSAEDLVGQARASSLTAESAQTSSPGAPSGGSQAEGGGGY